MENTTYISEISYKIENWLHQGHSMETIRKLIKEMQDSIPSTFPKNLELINAYYDSFYGSSACAFLDTNTGETIIGFAGTNLDNGWAQTANDFITDGFGLGVSGIDPDSLYMKQANEFINNLKDNGHHITQATGHSLGGALCVLAGLNHDIPLITTYNGAPLYGLPTAELTGIGSTLRKLYAGYHGKIVRFVSDEDWLNSLSDSINGLYFGDEYMIYNGRGHDIVFFKETSEQEFIEKVMLSVKNNSSSLTVDIDGDHVADISLTLQDLYIKNLFGEKGLYSGNGTDMKIDPQAFFNLQWNLKNQMAENDFNWIHDVILKCRDKNNSLKDNKESREDILIEKILEGIKQAQLNQVLLGIQDSHGKLLEQKDTISRLANFDTYAVTRKFDRWGSSGGRRWYLDGVEFDEYDLIEWIEDLKKAAQILYHQITSTGEFQYFDQSSNSYKIYKYDTLSEIGRAFVSVTNGFLEKSKETFHGTGLRSEKNDGIVDAISEVLDFELQNTEEMRKKVEKLSEIAGELANNFSNMDSWLEKKITKGEMISGPDNAPISQDYNAYLEKNGILDDVKDVLEAYDKQVEEATSKLSSSIAVDYEDLIERAHSKLKVIYSECETFKDAIDYLYDRMNKNVTSIRTKSRMVGYNDWEYMEMKDSHGKLSASFPSDVVELIVTAKKSVNPILPYFTNTVNYLGIFHTQINHIKKYFNAVIEQAVYNSMELDTIIHAQMLISMRIKRMKEEIVKIKQAIHEQYKGMSLVSYSHSLSELIKLYEYFDAMLNDCFGVNTQAFNT